MTDGQKQGRSFWFWFAIGGGVFLVFTAGLFWLALRATSGDEEGSFRGFGSTIGVVDVTGVILTAEQTEDDLRKMNDDASVKAIVLHINSPGGGAAASQEIFHEVLRLREQKKKPIIADVESVGASGAYYIASGADMIYANDASIVGSIGVIAEWINYGDLMQWAKLKQVTLKAGDLKEAGTPTRDPTPAEREYLQSLVDVMHTQFIADVAKGRHLKVAEVTPLASGRVWTGQEAVGLHLIDKIGTFQDCLRDTAKTVGIDGEPTIVRPEHPHASIFSAISNLSGGQALAWLDPAKAVSQALEQNPGFYYLWK